MSDGLRLFDERVGKRIDATYAVLVASDHLQFFPEMLEIFGKDAVIRFLDMFAGQTIVVPPVDQIEAAIRDVSLWIEVSKNDSAENVARLATDYELKPEQVLVKAAAVSERLGALGIKYRGNL